MIFKFALCNGIKVESASFKLEINKMDNNYRKLNVENMTVLATSVYKCHHKYLFIEYTYS